MELYPSALANIERLLGRPLDLSLEGKVTDLNEMPLAIIEEARKLPRIERREFLTFHMSAECEKYIVFFIGQVIQSKEDAATWRKGSEYQVDFPIEDLLTLDRDTLLVDLGPGLSTRSVPSIFDWRCGQPVGAPSRFMPEHRYFTKTPRNMYDCRPGTLELEQFEDLDLTVRRWIASRFARACFCRQLSLQDADALTRFLPPGAQATQDATIAMKAAICEERGLGPAGPDDLPGFRGPDDWYR